MNKEYIYELNGQLQYDYCGGCERPVKQIDLGDGVFGCEYCKSPNSIEVIDVEDEKRTQISQTD